MSPKPDVSAERKNQIVEAAMLVFARLGLGKARMDDVAQEAGLSKGTLYLYFKSKDAVIGAILDYFLTRELVNAQQAIQSCATATEKLHVFSDVMVRDIKRMKPLMSLYFEFMSLAMRKKSARDSIRKIFDDFIEILRPIMEEGVAIGEFRDINIEDAVLTAGAIFEGSILLWVYDPVRVDLEHTISAGIDLLVNGLKASGE